MERTIEKGVTYLDKLCHKLYDEPKGHGFQVDGECRHCGGHLMAYYCENRLYLIVCEKCGTLALTKSAAPQVAANLTLRKPTLTLPNEWVSVEKGLPELPDASWCSRSVIVCDKDGDVAPLLWARAQVRGKTVERWKYHWGRIYDGPEITHWMPLPVPPDLRPPEGNP